MLPDSRWRRLVVLVLAGVAAWGGAHAESLHDRALAGEVEAVRDLLADPAAELDAPDETGRTPLMCAVEAGHDAVVEVLLDAGASVDLRNHARETALHLAARRGRTASTRLLLRAGADLAVRDSDGRTPLYRAIEGRRADIIEMLQAAALAKGPGAGSAAPSEPAEGARPPRIIEATPAPYTDSARARGVEGTVVLMVLVRRDGSVGAASVSRGLEDSLDESALRTVREWKLAPAMRDGRTVEMVLQVEVQFRLPANP